MRIAFYELHESWEREYLAEQLPAQELLFNAEPLTANTSEVEDVDILSVFIGSRIEDATLNRIPSMRLLTARSTGFDHIDTEACAQRGIVVSNVPLYGENTVAEHALGLIINLFHKIHQAYERTKTCNFSLAGLEGMDLRGKVLGVIGAGSIGLHLIRVARAIGMEVVAFDTRPVPLIGDVLGFTYVALEDLLSTADVVSLHVPLLPQTRHLMNRERFSMMKRGALLVNTARGALVDTNALLWALDEGILGGAGLDVVEGEEVLREEHHMFRTAAAEQQMVDMFRGHKLLERDNVIITPHMAWFSREARERILATTVENIVAFLDGQPVKNRILIRH